MYLMYLWFTDVVIFYFIYLFIFDGLRLVIFKDYLCDILNLHGWILKYSITGCTDFFISSSMTVHNTYNKCMKHDSKWRVSCSYIQDHILCRNTAYSAVAELDDSVPLIPKSAIRHLLDIIFVISIHSNVILITSSLVPHLLAPSLGDFHNSYPLNSLHT